MKDEYLSERKSCILFHSPLFLVLLLLLLPSLALGQSARDTGYTHLYSIKEGIAAFSTSGNDLHILKYTGSTLQESRRIKLKGQIGALAETPYGLAVATGLGRGDLNAPIRVTLYEEGREKSSIFEVVSERPQVTFLKWDGDRLWLTYFASKFFTKTGYLSEGVDKTWKFTEEVSVRLGDVTALHGRGLLVGRPYGDQQGQDGDVLRFQNGERELLPSYRGVRSLASWGNGEDSPIVIGDGWHQNYGQLAQGRLSLLSRNSLSKKFSLELLDVDASQYSFSKLIPFELNSRRYVATLGNKSLAVYGPQPTWTKTALYSRINEDRFYDAALLSVTSKEATFVVLDGDLYVKKYSLVTK